MTPDQAWEKLLEFTEDDYKLALDAERRRDIVDRVCKPCRSNCNKCTGWNGCTECSNYNTTETQTKPDGSTQQV